MPRFTKSKRRKIEAAEWLALESTRAMMMTSNRPLEDWGKLIDDVPAATAILDRFLHHAEVIQITGKSYRLKGKRRKQAWQEEEK